ncbi:MAG: CbtA family protein [Haloarculaceae archaeon]
MFFQYLERGLVAGLVAGLVFGVFMASVGNPFVVYVDGLAHGGGHAAEAASHHHAEPVVSMAVTKVVSVVSSGFWGLLLGACTFGVAFFFLEPSIPGTGATKSYLLAAAGFVTVSGAPWLALPPAAPGMEQALSTGTRLPIYAGMMVAGLIASLLAGVAYDRLAEEYGRVVGVLGALVPLALLPVVAAVLPANPIHGDVPPTLVRTFRGFVVFGQAVLWFVLASAHAWLHRRAGDETADVETGLPDADAASAS